MSTQPGSVMPIAAAFEIIIGSCIIAASLFVAMVLPDTDMSRFYRRHT